MREAERRRQEQQQASFDQVAIERQMREQMHLEEQAMLFMKRMLVTNLSHPIATQCHY